MDSLRKLHLKWTEHEGFISVEKIPGLSTHAQDKGGRGLVELLEAETGRKLYVVHRLDKGTSGLILFATSPEAAAELSALFEKHLIQKTYWALTDRKSREDTFQARSFIDKKGPHFVSDPSSSSPNAETHFRLLKRFSGKELWEAKPLSGKPHQIRLHMADQGLALLGDPEHGGTPSFRLHLHAHELRFPWRGQDLELKSHDPVWIHERPALELALLDAAQNRGFLYQLEGLEAECLRLLHDEIPDLHVDRYGSQLWAGWYGRGELPTDLHHALGQFAHHLHRPLRLRRMQNRGQNPGEVQEWLYPTSSGEAPATRWRADENGVHYELRADQGQSPGLFLDQRENRLWVRRHAKERRVLNLFAYTSGFSVNAALGEAREICTVDVSSPFLEWSRRNFELNGLDPAAPGLEWWAQDCLLFLKGAQKRKRKWDLILCDPPSFGRSKEGVFQIHKHLPDLLELCLGALEKSGHLLLSCNYEGWTLEDFQKQVFAFRQLHSIEILPAPLAGLDFEKPDQASLMKSLIIRKR